MFRILLIILCLSLCVSRAFGEAPAEVRDPGALLDRIQDVTQQLDLTGDQKTAMDAIFRKAADDLQSAREDVANASQDEKTARYRDLLSDLRQQVGQVLSDDQKTELQQKLQTLRDSNAASTQPAAPVSPANSPTAPAAAADGAVGQRGGGLVPGGAQPGAPGRPGPPGRPGQFVQRFKAALDQVGLSDDQQTQVDGMFNDLRQQIQALRGDLQNGSLDRDAFRDKVQQLFKDTRTKLEAVLRPEQLVKLRQAMQASLPGGAGGGGSAAAGGAGQGGPRARGAAPGGFGAGGFGAGGFGAGGFGVGGSGAGFGNGSVRPPPVERSAARQPATAPIQAASAAQIPAPGQAAPDFSLKSLSGETVDLSSYNHKLLVLVLSSYTNPSFRDRTAGLEALRDQFGGRGVNFLIIYTREAHPTGGWEVQRNKTDKIDIAQPSTQAQRDSIAQRAREAMHLSIAVAPDTMDDKTATAYAVGDGVPAYLIGRDGKILFHQSWLEPMALGQAIEDAVK